MSEYAKSDKHFSLQCTDFNTKPHKLSVPISKLTAFLTMSSDIRFLPIWLDYHKHIFDSLIVVVSDLHDKNILQIVSRFFKDVSYAIYPTSFSRIQKDKLHISLSTADFLLESDKETIFEYCLGNNDFQKTPAKIRTDPFPNNINDFLQSIQPVDERYDIKILSFRNQSKSKIFERVKISPFKLQEEHIYYLDAYANSNVDWGEDRVILSEDVNLLDRTDFNDTGHKIFPISSNANIEWNVFLKRFIESKIAEITSHQIDAEKYHLHVNDEDHKKIINAMPYKKHESIEIHEFATYMETRVSELLGRRVKIFNDDIWIRICRPSSMSDYNPCHRDIYLDFYRNIVNIYLPIVGSNENSSLNMHSGSHLWNEKDIVVTTGGAYFKHSDKKYSVDAILKSRIPLEMQKPNPSINEFILFSPYLIHGCSSNDNRDITRMSIEIRFIEDNPNATKQEAEFNEFLHKRIWR
jgi:ectoine hydroxylase-related dioxygenase (phytanoyl-CoA dioxygenase family)